MTQVQKFSRLWLTVGAIAGATMLVACDRANEGGTNVTPPATSAPSTPAMTAPMASETPAMGASGAAGAALPGASAPAMGGSDNAMAMPPAMAASEAASVPARQP